MTTALFGVFYACGIWRLARNFGGPWMALSVAVITMACPVFMAELRPFYTQMPMTASVIWAMDALLRSHGLTRLGPSMAAGFFTAFAVMTKVLAPLYLAGPALVAVIAGMRRGARRKVLLHSALSLALAIGLAGPWYANHIDAVLAYTDSVVSERGQAQWSRDVPLLSTERLLYYPLAMANAGVGVPLAVLLLVAVALAARSCVRRAAADETRPAWAMGHLGAAALVSWLILTVGQVAGQAYYVQLIAPLAAVWLVVCLSRIASSSLRRAMGILIAIACATNVAFVYRPFPEEYSIASLGRLALGAPADHMLTAPARWLECTARPEAEPWPNHSIVESIHALADSERPRLAAVYDPWLYPPYLTYHTLQFAAWRRFPRLRLVVEPVYLTLASPKPAIDVIRDSDFILLDTRTVSIADAGRILHQLGLRWRVILDGRVTPVFSFALFQVI